MGNAAPGDQRRPQQGAARASPSPAGRDRTAAEGAGQRAGLSIETLGHGPSRTIIRYGFTETPNVAQALTASDVSRFEPNDVTYFVGRVTAVPSGAAFLSPWRDRVFAFISRNALSAVDVLKPPADRVVELDVRVER